jgi:sugar lactone lactonase YvrE
VIRQVDLQTEIITTFAKGGNCDLDLCSPLGIAVDSLGNLDVADLEWVLGISVPGGIVSVEAGLNVQGFNGDGRQATNTVLNNPTDVALDSAANLFTVDSGNNRVRKGAGSMEVATVAGGAVEDGGPGTMASLNVPAQTAFDQAGNLYIADEFDQRIRRVSATGKISTFAGTGIMGYSGDGGKATKATLNLPAGVTADKNGNVFIADQNNNVIRKVDKTGKITTFAGINDGYLPYVNSLATDAAGNVYAAATCTVYQITPQGQITDFAGGQCGYGGDGGPATQALLSFSVALAFDPQGNLYIADTYNNRVRMVNSQGTINTVAGNGTGGFGGDGGPAVDAMLYTPTGVAVDAKGNFYIADSRNRRIRIVDGSGNIETFAGTGRYGYNGNGLAALKTNMYPFSVSISPAGEVYFSDFDSFRVRKVH